MAKAFDPSFVTPTTPLRLSRALEFAFPAGGMTVAGVRLEASRGRLEIERVAGKDFVTLAAIERMRELCRVVPPTSVPRPSLPTARQSPVASEEERRLIARDALLARLGKAAEPSRDKRLAIAKDSPLETARKRREQPAREMTKRCCLSVNLCANDL